MSVTFDSKTSSGTFNAALSKTFSHTPTPGLVNPCAIVGVGYTTSGTAIPTCTYNGVSMVACGIAQQTSTFKYVGILFQLVGIDTSAAHDVVIDWGGTDTAFGCAGVAVFSGVDQTTPVGTAGTNTGTNTTSTIGLTIPSGAIGIDAINLDSSGSSGSGNGTAEIFNNSLGGSYNGMGQYNTSTGSVNMTWNWTGSSIFSHAANTVLPVAATIPASAWQYYRTIGNSNV
jgi:hypothetical protein